MRAQPLPGLILPVLIFAGCAAPQPVATPPPPAPSASAPLASPRPACQVPLTPDMKSAVAGTRISNDDDDEVFAVGPAGEVLANVDDELRLIQPDGTATTIYRTPDPKSTSYVVAAAINERWLVFGLDDDSTRVVDRRDGSTRTVPALSEVGRSFVLRDGTVYWITHPQPESLDGTLHSFDLQTSVSADVETGAMTDLRATETGLTWASDFYEGPRVFHALQPVPSQLASVPGIAADQISLVRDGDAYAWITGVAEGGTGVARWAPDTGLTRIATARLFGKGAQIQPSVYLAGPYLALGRMDGSKDYAQDVLSILVDTRSGALLSLQNEVVGGGGGTLAMHSGTIRAGNLRDPFAMSLLRADALPPMSCTSPEDTANTRSSCEMSVPAAWRKVLKDGELRTGGTSEALAAGPDGAVAVRHNEGETHELLLVDRDRSVRSVYRVANPDREKVGFAALDERWIVVGVTVGDERQLTRVDVIDRRDDSVRTVVDLTPVAGNPSTERRLDSVALFAGTVFWITNDAGHATVESRVLDTGAVARVADGRNLRRLRATAVGVAWTTQDSTEVAHAVVELPAPLTAEGVRPDDESLVTDGVAYAWLTETGVEHWSPDTGVTRVRLEKPWYGFEYALHVGGPYVFLNRPVHQIGRTTAVDSRTGGVVSLEDLVAAAGGGSMAVDTRVDLENHSSPSTAGLVRIADLPPLTC